MAHHDGVNAPLVQQRRHAARGLALARSRPGGAHRDDRHPRFEHGVTGAQEPVVRSRRERAGGQVHHVLVGYIRVAEDHDVHEEIANQPLELVLGLNRDPVGIVGPRERRRVATARDVRDLGGRERDDVIRRVTPKEHVEIVEVAASGAENQGVLAHEATLRCAR